MFGSVEVTKKYLEELVDNTIEYLFGDGDYEKVKFLYTLVYEFILSAGGDYEGLSTPVEFEKALASRNYEEITVVISDLSRGLLNAEVFNLELYLDTLKEKMCESGLLTDYNLE